MNANCNEVAASRQSFVFMQTASKLQMSHELQQQCIMCILSVLLLKLKLKSIFLSVDVNVPR